MGGPCKAPFLALLLKCERLQTAVSHKGLAWKAVAQPHLPMALLAQTEAQRLGLLAYIATEIFKSILGIRGVPVMLLSQPFSKEANVCR